MNIFLIPEILRLSGMVKEAISTGTSFKDIVTKLENPELVTMFADLGAQLFPKLAPELHAVAGIVTSYSPDHTKWLQGSLNIILSPSPGLDVDGHYGPRTRLAVERLQTQLGIVVDGWVGDKTSALIQTFLAK